MFKKGPIETLNFTLTFFADSANMQNFICQKVVQINKRIIKSKQKKFENLNYCNRKLCKTLESFNYFKH